MPDERKIERLVVLCTAVDIKRIGNYCEGNNIKNRSAFVLESIMKEVERWEKTRAGAKA